jgi:hypothetical protein
MGSGRNTAIPDTGYSVDDTGRNKVNRSDNTEISRTLIKIDKDIDDTVKGHVRVSTEYNNKSYPMEVKTLRSSSIVNNDTSNNDTSWVCIHCTLSNSLRDRNCNLCGKAKTVKIKIKKIVEVLPVFTYRKEPRIGADYQVDIDTIPIAVPYSSLLKRKNEKHENEKNENESCKIIYKCDNYSKDRDSNNKGNNFYYLSGREEADNDLWEVLWLCRDGDTEIGRYLDTDTRIYTDTGLCPGVDKGLHLSVDTGLYLGTDIRVRTDVDTICADTDMDKGLQDTNTWICTGTDAKYSGTDIDAELCPGTTPGIDSGTGLVLNLGTVPVTDLGTDKGYLGTIPGTDPGFDGVSTVNEATNANKDENYCRNENENENDNYCFGNYGENDIDNNNNNNNYHNLINDNNNIDNDNDEFNTENNENSIIDTSYTNDIRCINEIKNETFSLNEILPSNPEILSPNAAVAVSVLLNLFLTNQEKVLSVSKKSFFFDQIIDSDDKNNKNQKILNINNSDQLSFDDYINTYKDYEIQALKILLKNHFDIKKSYNIMLELYKNENVSFEKDFLIFDIIKREKFRKAVLKYGENWNDVKVSLYMYMHVYIYIYIYVYLYMCTYLHVYYYFY